MTDPITHKIHIIHDHRIGGRRKKCAEDRWENRLQKHDRCEKPVIPSKEECKPKDAEKVDCSKISNNEPSKPQETATNQLTDQEKRRLGRILSAKRGKEVVVTDKTRVSEEDLYALAVMNKINPKLKKQFIENLAEARKEMKGQGVTEFFPAIDKAMRTLIKDGKLTKKEFIELKKYALGKAQLDERKSELSGNRKPLGSGQEGSVIEQFRNNSEATMSQVRSHRWHQDKWERATGVTSQVRTPSVNQDSKMPPSGEFLWKPISESDGKLVILLPSGLTGLVEGVTIQTPDGKVIESGNFKGVANGGREHFRFSRDGGSFPDGAAVVIKLRDGSEQRIVIKETSDRFTR